MLFASNSFLPLRGLLIFWLLIQSAKPYSGVVGIAIDIHISVGDIHTMVVTSAVFM